MNERPDSPRRRPSFRSVLILSILALLFVAVGVVGVVSYVNARFIVRDLGGRALKQGAERIVDRVRALLDQAATISDVTVAGLARRRLERADLPEVVLGLHSAIRAAPELTYVSLGLETGDYCHVRRHPDGRLDATIQHLQPPGRAQRTDYDVVAGTLVERARSEEDYDPRRRPYYVRARRVGRQTWPAVYLFKNYPNPDYPGLTCATPILAADGRLRGVLTADFDLIALGQFLAGLEIFEEGTAFVLERDEKGHARVVAHPRPEVIVGALERGGETVTDILPLSGIRDPAVRTFAQRLPVSSPGPGANPEFRFEADGVEYLGTWRHLNSRHDVDWTIGVMAERGVLMAPVERSNLQTLLIGIASLVVAALLAVFLARRISKPLDDLARRTEAIAEFRLDPDPEAPSGLAEIALLSSAMEEMKSGLRSFQKYVPADLVRTLLSTGREAVRGGERRRLTVLFADVADFTAIGERLAPEALVDLLGRFLETVSEAIAAAGGTVDKFMGDAVMAFWGAPLPKADHAREACRAALDCRERFVAMNRDLAQRGLPELSARIGISTGELVVGNIGSSTRLNYTVIGDPVNVASRLEGLNKLYGTGILVSEATYEAARADLLARPVERVAVKGHTEGSLVYQLLAMRAGADADLVALAERSAAALRRYEARDFEGALRLYEQILDGRAGDGPARVMIERCLAYLEEPPPEDWDGMHHARKH